MNARIKELVERASKQSPDGYAITVPYSTMFAEKFAELVIKECTDYIKSESARLCDLPAMKYHQCI